MRGCTPHNRGVPMRTRELTSTANLAAWFGLTRARVIDVLKQAGLEPVRRGPRGVSMWDREPALKAMHDRPTRTD